MTHSALHFALLTSIISTTVHLVTVADYVDGEFTSELRCVQKYGNASYDLELSFADANDTVQSYSNFTLRHTRMQHLLVSSLQFQPRCVDVSDNELFVWPVFHCNAAIEFLNLSHNNLRQWSRMEYPKLKILDLSHNSFTSLQLSALMKMPRLEVLLLFENPIHIYGQISHLLSLKIVGISSKYWYAANSFDFGSNPARMVTENEMDQIESRQCAASNGYGRLKNISPFLCAEVALWSIGQVIAQEATCVSCYTCAKHIDDLIEKNVLVIDSSGVSRSTNRALISAIQTMMGRNTDPILVLSLAVLVLAILLLISVLYLIHLTGCCNSCACCKPLVTKVKQTDMGKRMLDRYGIRGETVANGSTATEDQLYPLNPNRRMIFSAPNILNQPV